MSSVSSEDGSGIYGKFEIIIFHLFFIHFSFHQSMPIMSGFRHFPRVWIDSDVTKELP